MEKEPLRLLITHPIVSIAIPILLSLLCLFYIISNMHYMHRGMLAITESRETEEKVYAMRNEIIQVTDGSTVISDEIVATSHIIMLEPSLVSVSR